MSATQTPVLTCLGGGRRCPGLLQRATRIALAVLLVLSHPLWAATIIVDETTCTLVDAITAANTDTATGGCLAGSGADTIELTTDVTLTEVNNSGPLGDNGLPVVESDVTIEGGGSTIERDPSAPSFRLIEVQSSTTFTVNDVTLRNGWADWPGGGAVYAAGADTTVTGSFLSGNSAPRGAAIFVRYGPLALTNSTVSGNTGCCGGMVFGYNTDITLTQVTVSDNTGTAISSYYADTFVLTDCVVSNNAGRGIQNYGPTFVTDTTVSDNAGKGIRAGALALSDSIVSDNSSTGGNGGGIECASATIMNSMVSGNSTDSDGGGIACNHVTITNSTVSRNSAANWGGGIRCTDATITNSTISGNTAQSVGGGIFGFGFSDDVVTITNSTVSGNSATYGGGLANGGQDPTTTVLAGSILANNSSDGNCWPSNINFIDDGNNFADDDTCGAGFADITPGVDFDTTLADNGGPTLTHALLPGSVAVNAAGECGLATDQRGYPRDDGACDSGSFELQDGGVPASSRVGLLVLVAILLTVSWAILRSKRRTRHPT